MNNFLEFIKDDNFLIFSFFLNIILLILILLCIYKIFKMSKEYIFFVRKIGNGNDLDKMLKKYLNEVE